MNNFLTLLKINLNVNFGWSALRYRLTKERDKIPRMVLLTLVVGLSIGSLVALYSLIMVAVYQGGVSIGNPAITLALAFLGLQLFLLVTGIFYVLGVFYYSKDLANFIPLPVKSWQVLLSKFSVVMAYEYLMALPILLPPLVIYGLGTSQNALYWFKVVLLILASPAIPLAIAGLIAMLLMRFFNLGKRKDLFAIIGGFAAVAGIVGLNLWTQRIANNAGQDFVTKLLASNAAMIEAITHDFPSGAWATFALSRADIGSWGYLGLFLAVSLALILAMLWLAERLYYKSALLGEEVSRSKPGRPATAAAVRVSSPVTSLFLKEMRLMLRTPTFALNCLMGSIILPVVLSLSLIQSQKAALGITMLLQDPSNTLAVTLGGAGLIMLTSVINVSASTCISREGRVFWLSRMIPVPPERQIYAKFLSSFAVAGMGIALSFIAFVAFFHFSLSQAVLSTALGVLGSIPITAANMIADIIRPKLGWTNPYEAVKQNMNAIIGMAAAALLLVLYVFLALGAILLGLPHWAIYAALALVFLLFSWASGSILRSLSKYYYKHEV